MAIKNTAPLYRLISVHLERSGLHLYGRVDDQSTIDLGYFPVGCFYPDASDIILPYLRREKVYVRIMDLDQLMVWRIKAATGKDKPAVAWCAKIMHKAEDDLRVVIKDSY